MTAFTHFLDSLTPLSEASRLAIEAVTHRDAYKRKHVLVEDLSRSEYLHFVEKGVVRAYYYHNGKPITDWFGTANMVVGPVVRRFRTRDTRHVVECLDASIIHSVRFSDLESLFNEFHEVERLGRLIAIQTILHLQRKLDYLQLYTAAERYEQFQSDYPGLLSKVSLHMVASFLDMNQVTLSRIRKKQ